MAHETKILTWTDDAQKSTWTKLEKVLNAVTALRPTNVTQLPEPKEGPGTNEWWIKYDELKASCCDINKPGFDVLIGNIDDSGTLERGFLTSSGSEIVLKKIDLVAENYESAPAVDDTGMGDSSSGSGT